MKTSKVLTAALIVLIASVPSWGHESAAVRNTLDKMIQRSTGDLIGVPLTCGTSGTAPLTVSKTGEAKIVCDTTAGLQVSKDGGAFTNLGGGGGGSQHVIYDESISLTARAGLDFLGAGVTCVDGGAIPDDTDCTIPGNLTADPTACTANQFVTDISQSGALTCAALTDADVPDAITVDWTGLQNYPTPTGGTPGTCAANEYVIGITDTIVCDTIPAASADVTAVGPGCTNQDCLTDGVATSGTTMFVWEGVSVDANQYNWEVPAADPGDVRTYTWATGGNICTDGAVCSGYSASSHNHTVGGATGSTLFTGADNGNSITLEGTNGGDAFDVAISGGTFTKAWSLIINEPSTGTSVSPCLSNNEGDCTGYGNVDGPSQTPTEDTLVIYDDTTGKLLDVSEISAVDTDADGLPDKLVAPGGFQSSARGCATDADCNIITIPKNSGAAGDPTCSAAQTAGLIAATEFGFLPHDDDTLHLCYGSTDLGVVNEKETDSGCVHVSNPTTDKQVPTIWRAPVALTILEIYCDTTGGTSAGVNLNVDDGAPAAVNGADITCVSGGATDSTLEGDDTMAAGDRLDLDIGTVTGLVTDLSVCIKYIDD